jgi:hypothetical protein
MADDPEAMARVLRSRAHTGDLWLTATGTSMGARFTEDARLLVQDMGRGPRVGEIWAFVDRHGDVIAHRHLRSTRSGRLVFCGDTAPGADSPVRPDWLIGMVAAVVTPGDSWKPRRIDAIRPVARAGIRSLKRRIRQRK